MKAITTILLFISINAGAQLIMKGKAINVYDGDTFTLLLDSGEKYKIRLSGIDAPEADQEYGIKSRDYARKLMNEIYVTVYCEPEETYGRKLAMVITANGIHVNYEMVSSGNAWHYSYFSNDMFLASAQEQARNNKIGLWSLDNPIEPWTYRRTN